LAGFFGVELAVEIGDACISQTRGIVRSLLEKWIRGEMLGKEPFVFLNVQRGYLRSIPEYACLLFSA